MAKLPSSSSLLEYTLANTGCGSHFIGTLQCYLYDQTPGWVEFDSVVPLCCTEEGHNLGEGRLLPGTHRSFPEIDYTASWAWPVMYLLLLMV